MARATYLAPGVYVEEVPSAQQPIAGVGTNTVGFIGIVQDVIVYPEPNPDYDPEMARIALTIASGSTEGGQDPTKKLEEKIKGLDGEIEKRKGEIHKLDEDIKKITDDLAQKESQIKPLMDKPEPDRTDEEKKRLTDFDRERKTFPGQLKKLNDQKAEKQKAFEGMKQERDGLDELAKQHKSKPLGVDEKSLLKPYILRNFNVNDKVKPGETKLCTNFSEYTSRFGPFSADDPAPDKHQGDALDPGHRALTHAVSGFFKNGGTRCFVARVKSISDIEGAMTSFESIDAIAIVAAPGFYTPGEAQTIWSTLTTHCDICEDRFAILDCPDVMNGELDLTLLGYDNKDNVLPQRNKNAAFYFPYIEVVDPAVQLQDQDLARGIEPGYWGRVYVPPSGHIAGIYARTDEERGVHKAPANTAVRGALNVQYYIGKPKQELLNPQGVNCIRNINGNITVWGARTIGGDSNGEWKYISVRRFFLFLRESIDDGTQWCVFEPNDPQLWGKIRRNVSAFLTNVWRSGALFGLTPEEAFYVKCDAETNPPEVRDLGMVVTEIGVAIVRPAEFVIFRITQSTGPKTS